MKKVLLVDDDDIFNFVHTRTLELSGIPVEIDTALNGIQAIALLNKYYSGNSSLPDAILLDLNMPEMDGFSFLEAIRSLKIPNINKVKIIVLTSSVDRKDMERVRQLGVTNYLIKPVTFEKIKEMMTSL